ncbi:UvrD-helicase domain-containing protein [Pseudomonas chlororaphis]|uniref:UvrD-helicase domain-containing protein n=1 Tax=Pseudomonas chlororaphis TaxID=587753 RepID=UPI0004727A09|nr:ATP-dependent helicase [Pseudomonas chlororaphis]
MKELSQEQRAIVDAPMAPLAVIACAGSGKTGTAVHRVVEMRRRLGEKRGRVALLSFSNVAVETFRKGYQSLAQLLPPGAGRSRVDIDTLDGFITANILRPHAYRTMGATQSAFLVVGSEPFLNGFTYWTGQYPLPVTKIQVAFHEGAPVFYYDVFGNPELLNQAVARQLVDRLGRVGAYTHDLGRYWVYRTLQEQPAILRALARRYPHIVVDESQDIGTAHQAILDLLATAGVQISLIGDPNQGIYEFAGADGTFLRGYHARAGVAAFALTRNYRSLPSILDLANRLSGRDDTPERKPEEGVGGACFIGYTKAELPHLMDAFHAEVANLGLCPEKSAILCRGRAQADELAGVDAPAGQGVVKGFASAAVLRDKQRDYHSAFKLVASGIVALMDNPPNGLLSKLAKPAQFPEVKGLHRLIWAFTRNSDTGLPSSELVAATEWHTALLERIRNLLSRFKVDFGFAPVENLGRKLAKRGLPETPLALVEDLAAERGIKIRVDTVHQVKGESIDAVLYVATKEHILAMLGGVGTELGRIGYVAITRARNLLWIGVPAKALRELRPALLAAGLQEAGAVAKPE